MTYSYTCPKCNKAVDIAKPVSLAEQTETCPGCQSVMDRVYRFQRLPSFKEYYDEQYKTTITSSRQEQGLMKKHGHIYAHDLLSKKYEAQSKHAKWKARRPHSVSFA